VRRIQSLIPNRLRCHTSVPVLSDDVKVREFGGSCDIRRHFPYALSLEPIQVHSCSHLNIAPPASSAQADFLCSAHIFRCLKTACRPPASGTHAGFGD